MRRPRAASSAMSSRFPRKARRRRRGRCRPCAPAPSRFRPASRRCGSEWLRMTPLSAVILTRQSSTQSAHKRDRTFDSPSALTRPRSGPRFRAALDRDVKFCSAARPMRGRRPPPDSAMRPRALKVFFAARIARLMFDSPVGKTRRHSRPPDAPRRADRSRRRCGAARGSPRAARSRRRARCGARLRRAGEEAGRRRRGDEVGHARPDGREDRARRAGRHARRRQRRRIDLNAAPPVAIMMVGLQGSGKTTTTAKIAQAPHRAPEAARC